jgi:hypothetical protein
MFEFPTMVESPDSSDRKPSPEDNVVQAIARDLPTVRWTQLARKRYRSTGGFTLFYPRQWSLRFYCRDSLVETPSSRFLDEEEDNQCGEDSHRSERDECSAPGVSRR